MKYIVLIFFCLILYGCETEEDNRDAVINDSVSVIRDRSSDGVELVAIMDGGNKKVTLMRVCVETYAPDTYVIVREDYDDGRKEELFGWYDSNSIQNNYWVRRIEDNPESEVGYQWTAIADECIEIAGELLGYVPY